jgi:RNA polymerase sigma-54 factor
MKTVLTTQITVTAQTVLASTLLRLSSADVEEAIRREVAENPALEFVEPNSTRERTPVERPSRPEDDPGWDSGSRRGFAAAREWDDLDPLERVAAAQSPLEQVQSQARLNVPAADLDIVSYLIQSLDEHGFLKIPEADLARELGVPRERVLRGIAWLQKLDPPGIGARDLRECFLLQCAHLTALGMDCSLVSLMLHSAWDCFTQQRWGCVLKRIKISRAQIDGILQFMRANLYPFPLALLAKDPDRETALTRPDLIVRRNPRTGDARFSVEVVAATMPGLRISSTYRLSAETMPDEAPPLAPAEREWVCQAIERARHFINALDQRRATLRRIGEFVVTWQDGFFEHGPAHLKPLTRAAVAKALGVHESTVSRAVSDKILQLPNGRLIEFSDLFDRSLAAKEAIRQLIRTSGGPLSDRAITVQLQARSFGIARRTVTKYRAQLGIPTMGRRQRARHGE